MAPGSYPCLWRNLKTYNPSVDDLSHALDTEEPHRLHGFGNKSGTKQPEAWTAAGSEPLAINALPRLGITPVRQQSSTAGRSREDATLIKVSLASLCKFQSTMNVKSALKVAGKLTLLIACLYFFICSLSFLADSFRMVGGRSLGGKY